MRRAYSTHQLFFGFRTGLKSGIKRQIEPMALDLINQGKIWRLGRYSKPWVKNRILGQKDIY